MGVVLGVCWRAPVVRASTACARMKARVCPCCRSLSRHSLLKKAACPRSQRAGNFKQAAILTPPRQCKAMMSGEGRLRVEIALCSNLVFYLLANPAVEEGLAHG